MEVTAPRWSLLSGQQSLGVHPLLGLDGQSDGVGRGADVLSPAINFMLRRFPSILHWGHPLQTRGFSLGRDIHFYGHIWMGKTPKPPRVWSEAKQLGCVQHPEQKPALSKVLAVFLLTQRTRVGPGGQWAQQADRQLCRSPLGPSGLR